MTASQTPNVVPFVIQEHRQPEEVHWDLMIQREDVLWTWRMACPPEAIADPPLPLERIADHPVRFLTYEGPVQQNTASVRIADRGTVEILDPTEAALKIVFQGQVLKGPFLLSQQSGGRYRLCRQPV